MAAIASVPASLFAICAGAAHERQPVVRLDPALDALVSPDAKVERQGFGFTEGPYGAKERRLSAVH